MLSVKKLHFSYFDSPILTDINLNIEKGENVAIIGESGCGKSTLLNLIYGWHDLNQGTIHWNNTQILGPKYNLVIGYPTIKQVTQEFDLMPVITVKENISKHLSRFEPEESSKRAMELIDLVQLNKYTNTKVKYLSGGQKQRVALARALAKAPELLLLDEPFSHIDNFKKQSLRRRVFKYLKEQEITCLVATHDKNDVLGYADKMVVIDHHKMVANNTPETLYKTPKTALIASFFGEYNYIQDKLVYAHQLKISRIGDIKVLIIHSYFNGKNYLIEAKHLDKVIYFENGDALNKGEEVFLEILD